MPSTRCRSCGGIDDTHARDCRTVERVAREKKQAQCDHREHGILRKLSDPPGDPQCGGCGAYLRDVWDPGAYAQLIERLAKIDDPS